MKYIASLVLVTALFPQPVPAQEHPYDFPRMYFFAAPGLATPGPSATLGLGGGTDWISQPSSFGYNFDLSYLAPLPKFGDGRGLLSLDACYVLPRHLKGFKFEPFLEAGYTRAFGPGSANLGNFGGGFNYWIHRDSGIRIEFRDHVQPGMTVRHFPQFRVAYVFELND